MALRRRIAALAAVLVLAAACTGGGGEGPNPKEGPPSEPWRGGTLRIADWIGPGILDPATNWAGYGTAAEIFHCCLTRTLISYAGVPAEDGGAEPVPDLATELPEVSSDGLTWTFRLREGLRYGPPLQDVEIVAGDIVRALERTADPATMSVYAGFFSMIEGFDAVRTGMASSISGLVVPEPHTLVVQLVRPAGDLIYRFSLPTTAPLPGGVADGHPDLSPFVVSTGPYMLEGSGAMDFTLPPDEQIGAAGYVLEPFSADQDVLERIVLVRNPSWSPSTDLLRPAYVDRIEIDSNDREYWEAVEAAGSYAEAVNPFYYDMQEQHARQIDRGLFDLSFSTIPSAEQVRRYQADPLLRDRLVTGTGDRLYYSAFNLAVPPFDDVHVRKAVSLALDRARIAELINADPDYLGATVANHLAPDGSEDFLLDTYRPSWSTIDDPDPDAARAEMRLSRYDSDGDGRCDAKVCRDVPTLVERTEEQLHPWSSLMQDALRIVGISSDVEVVGFGELVYRTLYRPGARWGTYLCIYCSWVAQDYPSASSILVPMLYGPSITDEGNQNHSLLGATPDQLEGWGYAVEEVPSVDDRIDACQRLVSSAQIPCWAELDQYLMEEVVPWIPLFFVEMAFPVSERVTHWSFDQRTGLPALDRVALVEGSE